MKINLKKNKIALLCGLVLSANIYAYDFNGTYSGSGKNNIVKLQISNNQVQNVYTRCSEQDCNMNDSTTSLLLNHKTALVTELKPLENKNKSIAYTTLILTPTNNQNKIQAVLVGYRNYLNPDKQNLEYKSEFTTTEILTKN